MKNRLVHWVSGAIVAGALLSGCGAGVVRRTITVVTNPPGAIVRIDGDEMGQTPLSTTVKFTDRDQRVVVEIIKDHYATVVKRHHADDPPELNYELEPIRTKTGETAESQED